MALNQAPERITLRQPDDWHVHLRDGTLLDAVVVPTARVFRRAIVMPNLKPPISSIQAARDYQRRILTSVPQGISFTPLMTIYLTDDLNPKVLEEGHSEGVFTAAKLYPANSTTNSAEGVTDIRKIDSVLEVMEEIDLPLLIHGEVVDNNKQDRLTLSIREFNSYVNKDKRVENLIIPIGDGLTVCRKL